MNDKASIHPILTHESISKRLLALDVMRGLTIAAMILVSTPGSWDFVYDPLQHSDWNNTTPTDLIFPFFVFMTGLSASISLKEKQSHSAFYKKTFLRFVKLMALGIFLNIYPEMDIINYGWSGVGYTSVLGRLGIVYVCCAMLAYHTAFRFWILAGCITLMAYWILLMFIPNPDTGTTALVPGSNIVHWIDQLVLNLPRGRWVPEGFLSTFPSIVTGISGMVAAHVLTRNNPVDQKMNEIFFIGFATLLTGIVFSWHMPDNKNLWTSTFVLISTGYALLSLSSLIYLENRSFLLKYLSFAVVFGSNAIFAYVLFHLLHPVIYSIPIAGANVNEYFMLALRSLGVPSKFVSLLFAVLFTAFCYIPCRMLYRRSIFIKL